MEWIFSVALSLHVGMEADYNAVHPHVRVQQEHFIAGAYYNSMNKISAYGGYRQEYDLFGVEVGAVTGYKWSDKTSVTPYFRVTYDDYFMSPVPIGGDPGVVIGYEYKF